MAALFAIFIAGALHAQALPEGVRLGMSADELKAALPSAQAVARPQRLSGGLVGSLRGAPALVAGLPLEPTFYFAGGQLRRVEFAASAQAEADAGARAFSEIVQWGRSAFGPELASGDPGSQYAAWVQGRTDVYAQRIQNPQHASVRLVYALRERKDDSQL
jgi:hypothetical protein